MDMQDAFLELNDKISIPNSKVEKMRKGRDDIRKKVKNEFKSNNRKTPKFHMQGSFAMGTAIRLKDEKYDLDDGVYIQGYDDKDIENWEKPSTIHNWIIEAVKNQTSIDPIDKNTCVRVDYKDEYHIDIPAYILKDDKAYLAHKKEGWIYSDPKKFTEWYRSKNDGTDDQLRRTIKYLKKWKKNKDIDIKGIEVTILAGQNLYNIDKDDLKSLSGTVSNIYIELCKTFSCYRPIEPKDEDLFKDISETRKKNILNGLKQLTEDLDKAINEESNKKASEILRKVLGEEFPLLEDIEDEYQITEKPYGVEKNDGKFA